MRLNGKWGFIDTKGAYLVKPKFDELSDYVDGLAQFTVKPSLYTGKAIMGYIDTKGTIVWPKDIGDRLGASQAIF